MVARERQIENLRKLLRKAVRVHNRPLNSAESGISVELSSL